MRIALYARVSTSRQQQTHTIDQQLTRLRSYVTSQADWSLAEEHIFCDDGYSGAKLKRPGLDHLRDQAALGAFDLLLLTTPDRLARNYVHQMVLLEELERDRCRVQFLDRPLSDDPHDQLVLQIRGAVAEYERTLIAERMRRGRQTKVRNGQLLPWTHTPYGDRAHPERPRDAALLQIDPAHAAIVQELFDAYGTGGVSLYQLAQRLTKRQVPSPTGVAHWTAATIRLIFLNPCYAGMAYANRVQVRAATRRKTPLQPVGSGESWCFAPAEEWIGVPVPALVSQELFDRVQARLAMNQKLSRRSTRHDYLLRGRIHCGHCHLQCYGHFRGPDYYYYLCRGKAPAISSCRDVRCGARYIPAEQVETLVWNDLCEVLRHPDMIGLALERAHSGAWLPEELQQRQLTIHQALRSLDRQRERLLAAYLAEAVELPEFERRQRELVQQRDDLQGQSRQLSHYSEQLLQVREAIPTIQAICERLQVGLEQATFAQCRQLVELLIDCVMVTDDQVEIRYVIPTTEASTHVRFCHLRKDYFDLEPQLVIVAQYIPGQGTITAEEVDMRLLAGGLMVFDDYDHIQCLVKGLVPCLKLIGARLHVVFQRGLFEEALRDRGGVNPLTIDSPRATSSIRAIIGIIPCRIVPQLGNQLQAQTASHQDGILIAKMSIQHQVRHGEVRADAGQETCDHGTDAGVLSIQRCISLGLGTARFRASRFPLGGSREWGGCRDWLPHHLLHLHRECVPLGATDQGEREQRDPWHRLPKNARKEAVHAEGLRACFGHHTFIPDQQHIIARGERLGTYEDPEDCRPRQRGMKEPLDGAIAATGSRPARESQHGHAPRHGQHRQRNPAQLPYRGHRDLTGQAAEQW